MKGYFVYCFYDSSNNLLYVGKTTQLESRMRKHFSKDSLLLDNWKTTVNVQNIILHECKTSVDLDIYETYFINKYTPVYNKDKVFNSIPSFELPYINPLPYSLQYKKLIEGSFKEYCLKYINNTEERSYIGDRYPLIAEAYIKLGAERMKSLSYNIHRIENEIQLKSDTQIKAIKDQLKLSLNLNVDYTITDIKNILNNVYKQIGINKKSTANDIQEYCNVNFKNKKINGKSTRLVEYLGHRN